MPYKSKELYHFLSGKTLPPALFIDLVITRCGDFGGLRQSYDRLRAATIKADATDGPLADYLGRHKRLGRRRPGSRGRALVTGLGIGVAAVIALTVLVSGSAVQRPTNVAQPAAPRPSAPQQAKPARLPDLADVPSSSRESSEKRQAESRAPAPAPTAPSASPPANSDVDERDPVVRCFRQDEDQEVCRTRSGRWVIIRDGRRVVVGE